MFNPFRAKTVRQASGEEPARIAPEEPVADFAPNPPPLHLPLPPAAPLPLVSLPAAAPPPVAVAAPPPAFAPPPPAAALPAPGGSVPLSVAATTALEQLVAKLPGLLFVGLTDVETSTAVRGRTPGDMLQAAPVARYHADLVRLERQALKHAAQGAAPEELREMLITMSEQLHLLRLVRDGQLLLSIVLDPQQISLPVARTALLAAANIIG